MSTTTIRGTIAGMGQRANPAFATAVLLVPLAALGYAVTVATVPQHTFVHVMAGVLWTGIDLFMGIVLGPVIGGLDDDQSAALFTRLTPKTAFLLPSLAFVTIGSGIALALRLGYFDGAGGWLAVFTAANVIPVLLLFGHRMDVFDDRRWQTAFALGTLASLALVVPSLDALGPVKPALAAALVLVTILSVQGFGFLLPGELRMYAEMRSASPDSSVIATLGKQNAMLGGVQGVFQVLLVYDMVYLRYGAFPF